MRTKTRAVLIVLCVLVLTVSSALGTIAYLTDVREVMTTFTIGQVKIELDETETDVDGKPIRNAAATTNEAPRTKAGNTYHLIPGSTYTKDPTVTVLAGSEPSYIRARVTFHGAKELQDIIGTLPKGLENFLTGWDGKTWKLIKTVTDDAENTCTLELRYVESVDGFDKDEKPADQKLDPIFKGFVVPGSTTNAQLDALRKSEFAITIGAHAIQTGNFADADEAWAAFDTPAAP